MNRSTLGILQAWIIIVTSSVAIQVADASPATPIPLLQYDMSSEDCNHGAFVSDGVLRENSMVLLRNRSTTTCSEGIGIEHASSSSSATGPSAVAGASYETKTSKALYTSTPIGSFLKQLKNNTLHGDTRSGISISLWIRPHQKESNSGRNQDGYDDTLTSPRTVFAIAPEIFETETFFTESTSSEEPKVDFQLSIIEKDILEVLYRTDDVLVEPCQRIRINVSSWNIDSETSFWSRPMHLLISLNNYHQEVFVNGKSTARRRERFHVDLEHWDRKSIIQFFNYPLERNRKAAPWDGQLFQFSIYGHILTKHEVKSVFSSGLPPSEPFANPEVVHIQEDASNGNKTLQQIKLQYSFLDDEVEGLLALVGIPHQPAATVRHYVTRFPEKGYLFHVGDERRIEPNGKFPVLLYGVDHILFVPIKDEYSEFPGHEYASFDFCVTKNKIFKSSQCVPATISVVVDPINDPPVAIIPPRYETHEGIYEEARPLVLTGMDVDKNDYIQAIQITSPPKLGFLFLSVSSFLNDEDRHHGTILSELNNTIYGTTAHVEYRFTRYEEVVVHDSHSPIIDFFRFRVQDSFGSWSSEAKAEVQVLSRISFVSEGGPNNWVVPIAPNQGASNILKGVDSSGMNRTLGFFISSLPLHGIILNEEGIQLTENEIIESKMTVFVMDEGIVGEVNVTYKGDITKCDKSKRLRIDDKFQYQVVALDAKKEVVSISSMKEEKISIVCPVEDVSIDILGEEKLMDVSAIASWVENTCDGYTFTFQETSGEPCSDNALVFGLEFRNIEKLSERVFVSITTLGGLISLKHDHYAEIPSLFDQLAMRSNIRMLLPVERLRDVLSVIHFQSDTAGMDEIRIVLQYGRCGHKEKFLREHRFSDSGIDCYKTEKIIYIYVKENEQRRRRVTYYPFPWISLLVIVLLGPIFHMKGKAKENIEDLYIEWKQENRKAIQH